MEPSLVFNVNAGEMYPEAKAFKDDNVRRYADAVSDTAGTGWIRQLAWTVSMILQQVNVRQD